MGGNLQIFVDVMVAACAIYMIYAAIKLKTKKIIDDKFLLPKTVDKDTCKDIDGYIKFMFPKFLTSAIIILIGGVLGLVNDFLFSFGTYYYIIFFIVIIGLIYIMVTSTKALKMFF